jgi:hypothetical protein
VAKAVTIAVLKTWATLNMIGFVRLRSIKARTGSQGTRAAAPRVVAWNKIHESLALIPGQSGEEVRDKRVKR